MAISANSKEIRKCLWCNEHILEGRSDKFFCNPKCKNALNNKKNKEKNLVFKQTDKYLHRNWEILDELYSLSEGEKYIDRLLLTTKAFRTIYFTGMEREPTTGVIKYIVYNYSYEVDTKLGVKIYKV